MFTLMWLGSALSFQMAATSADRLLFAKVEHFKEAGCWSGLKYTNSYFPIDVCTLAGKIADSRCDAAQYSKVACPNSLFSETCYSDGSCTQKVKDGLEADVGKCKEETNTNTYKFKTRTYKHTKITCDSFPNYAIVGIYGDERCARQVGKFYEMVGHCRRTITNTSVSRECSNVAGLKGITNSVYKGSICEGRKTCTTAHYTDCATYIEQGGTDAMCAAGKWCYYKFLSGCDGATAPCSIEGVVTASSLQLSAPLACIMALVFSVL